MQMDKEHTGTQPQAMLCDEVEPGRWKHRKRVGSPLFPSHDMPSALRPVAVHCAGDIPPAISRLRAAIAHIPRSIKAPVAATGSPISKPPSVHVPITYLTAPAGSVDHRQP